MEIDDRARRCQELFSQAIRMREAGDEGAARAKYVELAPLYEAQAREQLPAGNPDGWINLYAAITCAGRAGQFQTAASLIAAGRELSKVYPEAEQNIDQQLNDLAAWLQTLDLDDAHEKTADRVDLYLSACPLSQTFDTIRYALAAREISGGRFSKELTRQIIDSARHSLQAFTDDPLLALGLFGLGTRKLDDLFAASASMEFGGPWFFAAKTIVHELKDLLWQGKTVAGDIGSIAQQGSISGNFEAEVHEQGIRGIASHPVRLIDENRADETVCVLLALASQDGAFTDPLACHLLSQAAVTVQLVIQIGMRDQISTEDQQRSRAAPPGS